LTMYLSFLSQCARRGLKCKRPTESRRGVRRGKGRAKEAENGEDGEESPGLGESHVAALALRPRPDNDEAAPSDEDSVVNPDTEDRDEEDRDQDQVEADADSTGKKEEQ
jgi:hypothetical protein